MDLVSNTQGEGFRGLHCVDEICTDMKLVRNTKHSSATEVFDCLGKRVSAVGSLQQRLSTCAFTMEATAKKAQEKKALVAGDNDAQLRGNTSRAGHLEETQLGALGGSGGSDFEQFRQWATTGAHEALQELRSPGQPRRKLANRTARRCQASVKRLFWSHRQGLPLRSARLAPATSEGLGPSVAL